MAQYLKDEVRSEICRAALDVFADRGYKNARMSDIASAAAVSAGNIYRYYANKDDLFYSVITNSFVRKFRKILRRRVGALEGFYSGEIEKNEAGEVAGELLKFWIAHRCEVVILLSRSDGSKFADFTNKLVDELVRSFFASNKNSNDIGFSKLEYTFILHNIFKNTIAMIVSILHENEDEDTIRRLFGIFWTYQTTGLSALIAELRSS